jgi:hypothetical protein
MKKKKAKKKDDGKDKKREAEEAAAAEKEKDDKVWDPSFLRGRSPNRGTDQSNPRGWESRGKGGRRSKNIYSPQVGSRISSNPIAT